MTWKDPSNPLLEPRGLFLGLHWRSIVYLTKPINWIEHHKWKWLIRLFFTNAQLKIILRIWSMALFCIRLKRWCFKKRRLLCSNNRIQKVESNKEKKDKASKSSFWGGTLFKDNLLSQFYFPELFSLLHIHTWWGQSKYVRKFEISRANFEKTSKFAHIENFSLNFMW